VEVVVVGKTVPQRVVVLAEAVQIQLMFLVLALLLVVVQTYLKEGMELAIHHMLVAVEEAQVVMVQIATRQMEAQVVMVILHL
jgi:hypothetical protein